MHHRYPQCDEHGANQTRDGLESVTTNGPGAAEPQPNEDGQLNRRDTKSAETVERKSLRSSCLCGLIARLEFAQADETFRYSSTEYAEFLPVSFPCIPCIPWFIELTYGRANNYRGGRRP